MRFEFVSEDSKREGEMWAGDILKRNKVTSFHVGKSFRDLNLEEIYKVSDGKRNCKTFTIFR